MRAICAFGLLFCLIASPVYAGKTYTFNSKYYVVTTDLSGPQARIVADNLDAIYQVYRGYFSGITIQQKLAVYLFCTRPDYRTFVTQTAGKAPNKWNPAVFYEKDGWLVTVACLEDERSLTSLLTMFQHEGLHQFLKARFGEKMPTWADEGLACYFENMILSNGTVLTGIVPFTTFNPVYSAVTNNIHVPLEQLLTLTHEEWMTLNNASPAFAQLVYSEAWSVIYFIYQYDKGRNRQAFVNYIVKISQGTAPTPAFQQAFGTDFQTFETEWKQYIFHLRPDIAPVEMLELARFFQPLTRTDTLVTMPTNWTTRDDSFAVRVKILPAPKSYWPPDLIAYNPHCTLHLCWKVDANGKQMEFFILE